MDEQNKRFRDLELFLTILSDAFEAFLLSQEGSLYGHRDRKRA